MQSISKTDYSLYQDSSPSCEDDPNLKDDNTDIAKFTFGIMIVLSFLALV